MTAIRFTAEASASTQNDLIAALEAQAKAFFGEGEYRLEREVDVDAETVVNISGHTEITRYSGTAHYVNWREKDYSGVL